MFPSFHNFGLRLIASTLLLQELWEDQVAALKASVSASGSGGGAMRPIGRPGGAAAAALLAAAPVGHQGEADALILTRRRVAELEAEVVAAAQRAEQTAAALKQRDKLLVRAERRITELLGAQVGRGGGEGGQGQGEGFASERGVFVC